VAIWAKLRNFGYANGSTGGVAGLVPAPAAADNVNVLTGAGWSALATSQIPSVIRLATSDCAAHAVSTGVSETILKTFSFTAASLPTIGAGSIIRVQTLWTCTNSGNNKTLKIRIGAASAGTGGTALRSAVLTTTATLGTDVVLFVRSTSSQLCTVAGLTVHEGGSTSAPISAAIDLTANWEIAITGQTASSGETIQLEGAMVEILIP
jgi:hypothetical protein